MPETDAAENQASTFQPIEAFLESKKRKKSPSKADCSEFSKLWGELVREVGLSKAMPYLCQGFMCGAAEPLYTFVKEKGGSENEYSLIGSFPSVRDSKNEIELRIYLSLLSCELAEPTETEAIRVLVRRITSAAYNKEGKLSGNLSSYVRKLLVLPLSGKSISPLAKISMNPQEARPFLKIVESHLKALVENESSAAKEACAAREILAWAESLFAPEPDAADVSEDKPEEPNPSKNEQSDGTNEQIAEAAEMSADLVIAFIKDQQKRVEAAQSALSVAEAECSRLRGARSKLEQEIEKLSESLEKSRARARNLASDLDSEKERSARLEDEVAAAKEYADVIDKSATKESDETITRISRKLKIEYQDFQDAIGLDMDADLGENMRLQLQSVFKILKENGFDL